jgi:hypothetical protein
MHQPFVRSETNLLHSDLSLTSVNLRSDRGRRVIASRDACV